MSWSPSTVSFKFFAAISGLLLKIVYTVLVVLIFSFHLEQYFSKEEKRERDKKGEGKEEKSKNPPYLIQAT